MIQPILSAENVGIRFGGLKALDGVAFSVSAGEILSIIGPNGAGKTTLFNVVSGLYRATSGSVRLKGEDVTGMAPYQLARRGLSRTFQNLQIFFRMSVIENVMAGCHMGEKTGLLSDLLGLPTVKRQNDTSRKTAKELLGRVGLGDKADHTAGDLSYGALKRLEIARALATNPSILMLDEPAAGCNAVETAEIDGMIRSIADNGTAIVLVEHDMKLIMGISDRILVLDQGRRLTEGSPDEVRNDPKVIAAYLGQHGSQEAQAHA